MRSLVVVGLLGILCLMNNQGVHAHQGAGFGVKGEGASLEFDPTVIPAKQMHGFVQMKEHCVKCHTQERIVRCLQNCYAKGLDYDKVLREIIGKKLRLAGAGLDKEDGRTILEFLLTMYRVEVKAHDKLK